MVLDPYQTLGVSSSASIEEVKAAWLKRVRVLHPDRFDPVSQKVEWELATQMLQDVNAAWEQIRSSKGAFPKSGPIPTPPTSPPPPPQEQAAHPPPPPFANFPTPTENARESRIARDLKYLFLPGGRIGRGEIFIMNFVYMAAFGLTASVVMELIRKSIPQSQDEIDSLLGIAIIPIFLVFLWCSLMLAAKRVHDHGRSAWVTLFGLIPILNIGFGILLLVLPGHSGSNRYGVRRNWQLLTPPCPAVLGFAVLLFIPLCFIPAKDLFSPFNPGSEVTATPPVSLPQVPPSTSPASIDFNPAQSPSITSNQTNSTFIAPSDVNPAPGFNPPASVSTPSSSSESPAAAHSSGEADSGKSGSGPITAMEYNSRGLEKQANGDLKGAVFDYTEALSLTPNDPQLYYNRAKAEWKIQAFDAVIRDYTEAISLNPGDAHAYYGRGLARHSEGDLTGAISDYDEAIKFDAQFAEAYDDRGIAKFDNNDVNGAISDYDSAITINPRFALPYNNRGLAKAVQKNFDGAISDYTQALAIDPKDVTAYINRGIAKQTEKNYAGALDDFDQALSLDPDHFRDQYTHALAIDPNLSQAYQNRLIAKETQEVAAHDGTKVTAYINQGMARQAKGDYYGALDDYDQALLLEPDFRDRYTHALAIDPNLAQAYQNRIVAREAKAAQGEPQSGNSTPNQ